jgi:hypothetical protein
MRLNGLVKPSYASFDCGFDYGDARAGQGGVGRSSIGICSRGWLRRRA